jgi:hypothetical protein
MMAFERRWARQLLAAFAPVGGPGLAPLEGEVDYSSTFVRMMREATPLAALGLRAAVWMAALAPLWLWGTLTTINKLAKERHPQLLRELLAHRVFAVRELSLLLKLCAAMALLGAPSVRLRSGYDSVQPAAKSESGMRMRLPVLNPAQAELQAWPGEATAAGNESPAREVR